MCCLVQDVIERSCQKSDLLQGYGDTVLRAEVLEKELDKAKKHSALVQSKLDSAFTQYHSEVQEMQAKSDDLVRKSKSLHQKNKGVLSAKAMSTYWDTLLLSDIMLSCLRSLRHESTS
jgi:hypothetical protein